ncbi:hypothetical protein CQ14_25970 [Bradyrhizobium lablabi]|uniref:Uncharacterized protein n=1 Tax=Bradyrhizobium lablabi TaxID=722472 RepID=A0A0R3MB97_9BRAD|nr:hypothetical protein CQ14_25970 [Bradyrhizobium lablabi]
MAYDTATVHMLRNVLDEVLASSTFIGQKQRSALEIAETHRESGRLQRSNSTCCSSFWRAIAIA